MTVAVKSPEVNKFPVIKVVTKVNNMANTAFQKSRKKYIIIKFLCVIEKYVRAIANTTMSVINNCYLHLKKPVRSESTFCIGLRRFFSFLANTLTSVSYSFTFSILPFSISIKLADTALSVSSNKKASTPD